MWISISKKCKFDYILLEFIIFLSFVIFVKYIAIKRPRKSLLFITLVRAHEVSTLGKTISAKKKIEKKEEKDNSNYKILVM